VERNDRRGLGKWGYVEFKYFQMIVTGDAKIRRKRVAG